MAVVSVREIWSGRSGDLDYQTNRKYTRVFRVQTNNNLDGPLTVRDADGLPNIDDPYADANGNADTGSRLKDKKAAQDGDNPRLWIITCEFSSETDRPESKEQDPIKMRAKLSFRAAKRRVAKDVDVDGNAVVNPAEDPFDPPVEVDEAYLVMEIQKNKLTFNPSDIEQYVNTVNESTWFGMPAQTWLLDDLSADEEEQNGIIYYKAKYVFMLNRDTWSTVLLNVGYNELVGGNRVAIRDQGEQKEPQLLDADGTKLAVGGNPTYTTFRFYRRTNFANLEIF